MTDKRSLEIATELAIFALQSALQHERIGLCKVFFALHYYETITISGDISGEGEQSEKRHAGFAHIWHV